MRNCGGCRRCWRIEPTLSLITEGNPPDEPKRNCRALKRCSDIGARIELAATPWRAHPLRVQQHSHALAWPRVAHTTSLVSTSALNIGIRQLFGDSSSAAIGSRTVVRIFCFNRRLGTVRACRRKWLNRRAGICAGKLNLAAAQ